MNITVLCGGISSEREISLRSSVKISQALKSYGHNVVMIDVFFGSEELPDFSSSQDYAAVAEELRNKESLITDELIKATGLTGKNVLEICRMSDIVFIGLHGKNGEDGKIQAILDSEGIKYTGSGPKGSAIAMSKEKTKEMVADKIRMPEGTVIHKNEKPYQRLNVPCVLKPSNGGSSVGVFIVRKDEDYDEALSKCFEYDDTVIAETFIDGKELTQGVINGIALPPVEIIPDPGKWYDYSNKYNGLTVEVCPAQLDRMILHEMSRTSRLFGKILGLDVYYRVDYLLDSSGKLYALEANTLPGMTDTSLLPQEAESAGISYTELCEIILEISLNKYK